MKLTPHQLKDIVESLECGMTCHLNRTTGKIISYPESDYMEFDAEDPWAEDKKEISEQPENFIQFVPMNSNQTFGMMVDFKNSVDSPELKEKLESALNGRKPMRNFKYEVDESGDYRQEWFDFRTERNKQWVLRQLDNAMHSF